MLLDTHHTYATFLCEKSVFLDELLRRTKLEK